MIPHWHPNQLRHNAATRLRREFGLDMARAVLGHSSAGRDGGLCGAGRGQSGGGDGAGWVTVTPPARQGSRAGY